jgi:hypothetical protein
MRKLKLLFLGVLLLQVKFCEAQINPAIASYVKYINSETISAKEYVLGLFKTHDIVIICERLHPEFTQYDFLLDVISDKRFISKVGNVFTEVGVSSLNPSLNTFLHNKNLSKAEQDEQILDFRRDLMWSVLWEPSNYTYLLESIYNINSKLDDNDAINLYPSDIPFDWKKADSLYFATAVLPLIKNRDSVIASQIIGQFDQIKNSSSKHKKALVIMNYRHAFNNNFYTQEGKQIKNVALFLFKQYGNKVANVLLNCNGWDKKDNALLLQQGKWDAAFAATGNKSKGFNLVNTPFGKDSFDLWVPGNAGFTYQDVFTGFVFYNPIEVQKLITGIPGFLDSAYLDEFFRRYRLSRFVPTNMRQFSDDEITQLKKNPQDIERDINEKKERQLPNIDSLILIRNRWLK